MLSPDDPEEKKLEKEIEEEVKTLEKELEIQDVSIEMVEITEVELEPHKDLLALISDSESELTKIPEEETIETVTDATRKELFLQLAEMKIYPPLDTDKAQLMRLLEQTTRLYNYRF